MPLRTWDDPRFLPRNRFSFGLDPGAGKFSAETFGQRRALERDPGYPIGLHDARASPRRCRRHLRRPRPGGDRDRILSVMDDSHTGVFGLVAIVSVLLLKIHALESMDVDRWRALLVALSSGVGRWCYWLSLQGSQSGTGFEFNRSFANQAFSLATLLTLLLVAVIFRGNGIYMMAWVAVFTTASKSF